MRFGRRTVLIAGTVLMVAGLALTLTQLLALIMAGLLLFTGGFFAAHSIGAGWTGVIATTGRAQAASLYNLAYYLGSSVIGWAGGPGVPVARLDGAGLDRHRTGLHDGGDHRRRASRPPGARG